MEKEDLVKELLDIANDLEYAATLGLLKMRGSKLSFEQHINDKDEPIDGYMKSLKFCDEKIGQTKSALNRLAEIKNKI